MDVRTIEAVAGIGPGMANVWISRGYIPGVSVGTERRPRVFDLQTATRIGVWAELARLRVAPEVATAALGSPLAADNKVLLLTPHPLDRPIARSSLRAHPHIQFFKDPEHLDASLKSPGGLPTAYSVIHVWIIEEAMRRAEQGWQARQAAGDKPKGRGRRRAEHDAADDAQ
jgi:hypothetical protein